MPLKPARPCPGRGPRRNSCPNLVRGIEHYCPECAVYERQSSREYDQLRDQGQGRQFLHSATWRRIRDAKLARDPLCERCMQGGRVKAAVLVHHKDRNERNNEPENHESLCNPCHEVEHREERWSNEFKG